MVSVRSAILNGYVDQALDLGLNPHMLLRSVGIDPASLGSADSRFDVQAVDLLLERSAAEANCEDFGIRLAASRGLSILGPVALAAREEPDVRSALALIIRHLTLHNPALRADQVELNGLDTVRVSSAPGVALGRQSIETAVAAISQIMREFLGPQWLPVAVYFTHAAPVAAASDSILGSDIRYEQEFNGIVFYSRDLDAENPLADPNLRPYARRYLESLAPSAPDSIVDRVRSLIETLLPTERCTINHVSHSLGMDRKTLYRHLAKSGETYSAILDAVRIDLAVRYVRTEPDRSLSDIAAELGFSELSAFSRWFRSRFGVSPTAWRRTGDRLPSPQVPSGGA